MEEPDDSDLHHPPLGSWGQDLLGPGFQARTLPLKPDAENDGAVATLVRYVPELDSCPPAGARALLRVAVPARVERLLL